jgi:hypothetical protein
MKINNKKSGITILRDDGTDSREINGFPVVNDYKYLGVRLDNKLTPKSHIFHITRQLSTYLKRKRNLCRKYFTPSSLLRLSEYLVKSTICCGTCIFVKHNYLIKKLNKVMCRHLKYIINLADNISQNRMLLSLGEPNVKVRLLVTNLKRGISTLNSMEYFLSFREIHS